MFSFEITKSYNLEKKTLNNKQFRTPAPNKPTISRDPCSLRRNNLRQTKLPFQAAWRPPASSCWPGSTEPGWCNEMAISHPPHCSHLGGGLIFSSGPRYSWVFCVLPITEFNLIGYQFGQHGRVTKTIEQFYFLKNYCLEFRKSMLKFNKSLETLKKIRSFQYK